MGKYLAKIIASDQEGLQMISACSSGAKVKVADIKYLASNKVFLISIERTKIETNQEDKKINSICRFDFVDKVRSKNIDQSNQEMILRTSVMTSGPMPSPGRIRREGFVIWAIHLQNFS